MESESAYYRINLADPEASRDTRGYIPITIRRPPMANMTECGVDRIFLRDLPRFLLTQGREALRYDGTDRLTFVMRWYQKEVKSYRKELRGEEIPVFDEHTKNYFNKLCSDIEQAVTPNEKVKAWEDSFTPWLKSLDTTREGEKEINE